MKKIMFSDKYGLTEAVLKGRKTMTRRIVKHPREVILNRQNYLETEKPHFLVGEVVAVAQSYMNAGYDRNMIQRATFRTNTYGGKQIGDFKICLLPGWKNKMYVFPSMMPHQIRITNVRAKRLQDISDEDCLREGIKRYSCDLKGFKGICYSFPGDKNKMGTYMKAREAFAALIDKISGKGVWKSNPWVFVYEFKLIR